MHPHKPTVTSRQSFLASLSHRTQFTTQSGETVFSVASLSKFFCLSVQLTVINRVCIGEIELCFLRVYTLPPTRHRAFYRPCKTKQQNCFKQNNPEDTMSTPSRVNHTTQTRIVIGNAVLGQKGNVMASELTPIFTIHVHHHLSFKVTSPGRHSSLAHDVKIVSLIPRVK